MTPEQKAAYVTAMAAAALIRAMGMQAANAVRQGPAAEASVSTGPCYADPSTTLRFADEVLITQEDGVGCYAVYTVFTDHVESFCPCPDPKACEPALTQLSNEASGCPALLSGERG